MDVKSKTNVWTTYRLYSLHVSNQFFGQLMDWICQRLVFVVKVPICYRWWFGPLFRDTGSLFDVGVKWKKGVEVSLVGSFGDRVLYGLNSLV